MPDKDLTSANDLPFLVVIRSEPKNLLFGFPSREERDGFVQDLKVKWPHLEYMTSEVHGRQE